MRRLLGALLLAPLVACQPGACPKRLAGTGPFARELTAPVTFRNKEGDVLRSTTERLEAWFPEGRVPGGRFLLTHRGNGSASATGALLSVPLNANVPTLSWFDGPGWDVPVLGSNLFAQVSLTGTLHGPDNGIEAHLDGDANQGDVVIERASSEATATFCSNEQEPAPGTIGVDGVPFPLASFRWTADVPIDPTTVPAQPLSLGGLPIDGQINLQWTSFSFVPASPLPPGVRPSIDISAVRDLLGRPIAARGELPQPLTTTAVVTDLSFAEQPPPGSIVTSEGASFYLREGEVYFSRPPYAALMALGDPGLHASATLHVAAECNSRSFPPQRLSMVLVSADGTSSAVPLQCVKQASPVSTVVVPVPASGPLWLAIRNDSVPCFGCSIATVRVGAISFE